MVPASPDLAAALLRRIEHEGPIGIDTWMAAANAAYYAARDPFGSTGDFVTAPEISQMFGELIGLVAADLWDRAGRPRAHYVELGPGRGTLAADALRAMAKAGFVPQVHFVETSPALRAAQADRVPGAIWHDDTTTLPADAALLVVANEFFDALPIRQFERTADGWRERRVGLTGNRFAPVLGDTTVDLPIHPDAPIGSIVETAPAARAVLRDLAPRIATQGGALLAIDYGYPGPALGDTLQAVSRHAFADPFADPGRHDLSAHVDFAALAAAAPELTAHGPVAQGAWLAALGIAARAAALARAAPDRADEIAAAHVRLVGDDAMGRLFLALALTAPGWPIPAGF